MAERRPRVAIVSYDVLEHAGAERVVLETIRRTRDAVDWAVVSRSLPEPLRGDVRWLRVSAPDKPFRLKLLAFIAGAEAQLARGRFDVVHVSGPILLRRADLVSVHFLRGAFYEALGAPRRAATALHVALEAWFLRRARLLATPSLLMQRELERRFPGAHVRLVANGVDHERFRPDPADRVAVRRELGVSGAETVALFVGNAWTQKGLPIAIDALAIAAARGAAVRLWVCGLGDPDRYRGAAERAGVGDAVRFLGVRSDLERLYRAADLLVFPAIYETFPLTLLEAAASGLPLVVTPVGGAAELVGAGEGGVVVRRDAESVAAALVDLAGSPDRRERLGHAARLRASAFTWERSVAELLAVYRELGATVGRSSIEPS